MIERPLRQGLRIALAIGLALGQAPAVLASTAQPRPVAAGAIDFAPVDPAKPTQVVVFDRGRRTTTLVSHDPGVGKVPPSSSRPSISDDGRFVAYETGPDINLWDGSVDQTQRLTIAFDNTKVNGASHTPSISGDGGVVAFSSVATNLVDARGQNGTDSQVFMWQRSTGVISLVSVVGDRAAPGSSTEADVSRDGHVIAFVSSAAKLDPGDSNAVRDVFLRDTTRGVTIRASVKTAGGQVGQESRRPSVSGDGGAVVFDSTATNLVPQDTNKVRDVLLRDLPPAVVVSPNPLEFGLVPIGTPATQATTVTSVGWTPVTMAASRISGPNAGDFVVAGDACAGLVLAFGASCTIAVLDVPLAAGPRKATLEIFDSALDSPQLVALTSGVPAAEVRLDPAVGPPGIVTVLHGTGFPPGALVSVQWDRGISQALTPAVVAPDGSFSIGILVFHHDRLGLRQLLVTPAPGGPGFTTQTVAFVVLPGTLQPPGTSAIEFLAPDLQLILTRR